MKRTYRLFNVAALCLALIGCGGGSGGGSDAAPTQAPPAPVQAPPTPAPQVRITHLCWLPDVYAPACVVGADRPAVVALGSEPDYVTGTLRAAAVNNSPNQVLVYVRYTDSRTGSWRCQQTFPASPLLINPGETVTLPAFYGCRWTTSPREIFPVTVELINAATFDAVDAVTGTATP